jgi:hypothetical protein
MLIENWGWELFGKREVESPNPETIPKKARVPRRI